MEKLKYYKLRNTKSIVHGQLDEEAEAEEEEDGEVAEAPRLSQK